MWYDIIEALVLGLVQGLTEFLPVSSSGHLEIAKALFGQERVPEESLALTVLLHVGTALATVWVFRRDIIALIQGMFVPGKERNFVFYIAISMLPAGLIGFLLEDQFSYFFSGRIGLVGVCLWVTALLLYISERKESGEGYVNIRSAWWIGISQAVALLPGVSRSGATISTALILGIERKRAARFSFLMVIPLILGKLAKDVLSGEFIMESAQILPSITGLVAAFVSGWLACVWMIRLVQKAQLRYFALYCFLVGAIAIISSFLI
jgi:undecaprenyl-diphosphatase